MGADRVIGMEAGNREDAPTHARVVVEETGQVLVKWLEEARSLWSQFRGLMLRPELWPGDGLLLRNCGAIHTAFVRFSVDAVFFDKHHRVTRVSRNVRPWCGVALGGPRARGVLELPAGAAAALEPGYHLRFEAPG